MSLTRDQRARAGLEQLAGELRELARDLADGHPPHDVVATTETLQAAASIVAGVRDYGVVATVLWERRA